MKYNLALGAILLLAFEASALRLSQSIKHKHTDEESNIQIQNIYGIPSEEEKLQIKAAKMSKERKQKITKMRDDFAAAFNSFSKNLKEADFDKALKLKNELLEMNESQTSLDKIKINSVELFQKQFQFPEVAKNDFSTQLLDELEIAEKNLNSNLDNVDLYNNFVETAESTKKKLKEKYGDQWTDPAKGSVVSETTAVQEDDD